MDSISSEVVEGTWTKLGEASLQEAPKMIERLSRQQPIIMAYLMAVGGDGLNEDERKLLFYLGVVVWQIMSQGTKPLPEITERALDKAEESNMKMIEYLEGKSDKSFIEYVERMINNYNQPEVLRYILEALMEDSEEEGLIRDEHVGMMMIYLKTVIDCLDK